MNYGTQIQQVYEDILEAFNIIAPSPHKYAENMLQCHINNYKKCDGYSDSR